MNILLDEFVNGYSVRIFTNDTYIISEIYDTKIEALSAIKSYLNKELYNHV